jgi:hypothetical protein
MGELERIDATIAELMARRNRLETERASLARVGAVMGLEGLQDALRVVRAHRPCGGRGSLISWLRTVLQAASPEWVDTRCLVALAQQEFGLTFATRTERDAYRKNSIGRALRKLLSQGLAERQHDPGHCTSPGRWRWKLRAPAAELLAAAARQEAV